MYSQFQPDFNAQQIKFSIKDFSSKCDQIRSKPKKSLMENFIFCAVFHKSSQLLLWNLLNK